MPWNPIELMSLRKEFVNLALQPGANRRELCRRFGISPQTGYKWLARHAAEGPEGLADRSRRPHASPGLTPEAVQATVVELRAQHPYWGGRKISRRLHDQGLATVAPSTVSAILHRHGLIHPPTDRRQAWQRFEHVQPNALWQADFKGYFETLQGRCSPLTVLDDHSRYNLVLEACGDMRTETVQACLETAFRRYGLPLRMNFDNGAPWGCPKRSGQITTLGVWLVRLGIQLSFSRPYHPQTNGKEERFHRSLAAEVLNGRSFESLAQTQQAFDRWRYIYNHERPHDALRLATPISRYQPSPRRFPETLPPIDYGPDDTVLMVGWSGEIRFRGQRYRVSSALHRQPIAVRPRVTEDGIFDVYFAHHHCLTLDLNQPSQTD